MIEALFQFLNVLLTAARISSAIEPYAKNLTPDERNEYSVYIVQAGEKHKVDPFLVAAVMWHESWFNNLPRNQTNDYGLMQVHWQKSKVSWLVGLTTADLMIPRTNIFAGTHELAHMRWFCRGQGHRGHDWVGHYKWGVVVMSEDYGKAIMLKYGILRSHRPHARRYRPAS